MLAGKHVIINKHVFFGKSLKKVILKSNLLIMSITILYSGYILHKYHDHEYHDLYLINLYHRKTSPRVRPPDRDLLGLLGYH